MKKTQEISGELKQLVSQAVRILGEGISEVFGADVYDEVEHIRQRMKKLRNHSPEQVRKSLEQEYRRLSQADSQLLHQISKSYSLMLELINSCEAAYRIFRLSDRDFTPTVVPQSLVYVFTSHPTEARSKNLLILMDKVESLLLEALIHESSNWQYHLSHLLKLALRLDLANNRRPAVMDEAEQIFHTVLAPAILEEQVELHRLGINVLFRTWVGGDKDGHPKVGPETLKNSLELSRGRLLLFIESKLKAALSEAELIKEHSLSEKIRSCFPSLRSLRVLTEGDGRKVLKFKKDLRSLRSYAQKHNFDGPNFEAIENIIWIYPALVLPLEIREDSEQIHIALKNKTLNIAGMLKVIKQISRGMDAKWYVRGFIISMCQTSEDVLAAASLVKQMTGELSIPVVPLFENKKGLKNAKKILTGAFAGINLIDTHLRKWNGRFEVMLGYSDSSKENGVLPGRLMVERALLDLESFLVSKKLTPVFFHGSGGSVSRGGGSIKEQIAWWPQSALNIFKVTIQGETVQRHFHHPLIMRSQVTKIVEEFANYKPRPAKNIPEVQKFAEMIQTSYRQLVQDEKFQTMVAQATPYEFLNHLRIGSRPTKRSGKGKFTLRAIPWILCWTQSRLLLPIWWGVGSAWSELSSRERIALKKAMKNSPLFESYIKNLGFTLAKVELGVWKFLLAHSGMEEKDIKYWNTKVDKEIELTFDFFKEILGHENLTWFNPRLGESIYFRSSMIHPLNLIQKISLERKDLGLLRESVTGIASGMLTTG